MERGTGSAALVVMLGGGVCSAVTGVSIPERSLREGVVWRVLLIMTSRRGEVHTHALGVVLGRVVNALLRTAAPTASAAGETRPRNIVAGKGPVVDGGKHGVGEGSLL